MKFSRSTPTLIDKPGPDNDFLRLSSDLAGRAGLGGQIARWEI